MKRVFVAAILATTFLTPVSAAELTAESNIDAVTVYPRGAEVTRYATIDLERGDHTLTLDDLPGEIDPHSIRVEGSAPGQIEIASVDSKIVHVTDDVAVAGERKRIELEIEGLQDQLAALDQMIEDATYQRKLLQELASKPFSLQGKTDEALEISSTEFGNMFDLVATRISALSKTVLESNIQKRSVNREISDLHTKLSELAPKQRAKTIVTVHLSAADQTEAQFKLRYRIANAGWQPYYEARLDTAADEDDASMMIVRRAEVTQNTTERWEGVKLTLSTARPTGSTAAPELRPELISILEQEQDRVGGLMDMMSVSEDSVAELEARYKANQPAVPSEKMTAQLREAEIQLAGFQALYGIQGRVTIDNSGTAKKVRISSDTLTAKLSAVVVPKLDHNAYLTANFTLDGEAPMLRGRVMLFRDGVYMGNGVVPMLSPGEEHTLGFGIDDKVKVKRIEVKRHTSETGLISTDKVEVRSWSISVDNLHDGVMPVTVYDQLPYSTHEDIDVDMLSGSTKPTDRDVDKKRGVLAWSYDLESGEKREIKFGYRITRPEDTRVQVGWN